MLPRRCSHGPCASKLTSLSGTLGWRISWKQESCGGREGELRTGEGRREGRIQGILKGVRLARLKEKRSGKMPFGVQRSVSLGLRSTGKRTGVCLPPKCPICVFPTNSAVSFSASN